MRSQKKYYAIAEGAQGPRIVSSWSKAHADTSGHPRARHKSFDTVEEVTEYMERNGCKDYAWDIDPDDWKGLPSRRGKCVYGVASGRETGVYDSYSTEAQPHVHKYKHACHKAYRSPAAAEVDVEQGLKEQLKVLSLRPRAKQKELDEQKLGMKQD